VAPRRTSPIYDALARIAPGQPLREGIDRYRSELIKDPYSFDFLALGPDMSERELERSLLDHLRFLILELGKGFAFVGSQYPLQVGGQDYYLDLLFYHLRLRCFVVLELKIEDFKPEFAGKMNFYLSAVDDQLRHGTDGPSIGIILCKGKNAVVVEYALRDSAKPMGVAEYRLSPSLPSQLQGNLPTAEELAREFPLMSAVKLRIEIERELRLLLQARGRSTGGVAIGPMLQELDRDGIALEGVGEFEIALQAMNQASHGLDVDPNAAEQAIEVGTRLLEALKHLNSRCLNASGTIAFRISDFVNGFFDSSALAIFAASLSAATPFYTGIVAVL